MSCLKTATQTWLKYLCEPVISVCSLITQTTPFVMCLSVSLPIPAQPTARLWRGAGLASVSITEAVRVTSARLDVPPPQSLQRGSAVRPHMNNNMHESNLLIKHTLILHLFIIGSFPPPPPNVLIDPPTLSFLMSSCSNVGFRFGRLMELAQGSAAQGWGGDRYITGSIYY